MMIEIVSITFPEKKLKCSETKLGVVPFGALVKRQDFSHAARLVVLQSCVCGKDQDLRKVYGLVLAFMQAGRSPLFDGPGIEGSPS